MRSHCPAVLDSTLCRRAKVLALQVFLFSLATRCLSQGIDSTAPRLVTMSPIDTRADVWLFAIPSRCTPESCSSGARCNNQDCTATAKVRLSVQDLPAASGGQEPAGIKSVSVRFASPTAQRQGIEASFDLDENIDLSLFGVGRLDFQAYMRVGMEPEGTALEVPVIFDGYAEAGDWRLDSVALTDHVNNQEVINRDFLASSGYAYSISVSSLELSTCSGTCAGAAVTCRQFGSPTADSSQSPQQRIWWRCSSSGASSSQQGACCAACGGSQLTVTQSGVVSSCQPPAQALRLSPCGCAESGVAQGWQCTNAHSGSSLGVASVCAGGSGPWCHHNVTGTAQGSCAASGEGRLMRPANPSAGSPDPSSAPGDSAGPVPGAGAAVTGPAASAVSNSSNTTGGQAQEALGQKGGDSAAPKEEADWWEVEVRQSDPSSVLIGLACMMGFFAGFLCIYFENRLRAVFRPAQVLPGRETQNAATSMARVHQPETGEWVAGTMDLESAWDEGDEAAADRLRARSMLARELGVGLGGRGRPSVNARGGGAVSRAEAIARLREMGFGPIDASQAFAAVGASDVNLAADWILSRGRLHDTIPAVGGRGSMDIAADHGHAAWSWSPGDTVMSAAEARRHGRQIRRAGSLPSAAVGIQGRADGSTPEGMRGERGWGVVRDMVRGGGVVGGGRGRSSSGLRAPMAGAALLPRRSQSVTLPGACDEGSECCVCMDAPIQVPMPRCSRLIVTLVCAAGWLPHLCVPLWFLS